jgi:hypothetical protein
MAKGDVLALPALVAIAGSLDGTMRPMTKMDKR